MCGIVGYVGRRDACPILIKGLHRLEYRGYDSAGVALVNPDGRLNVFKCKGKVSDLEHFLDGKDLGGNIGIAHTRWATHGVPNDANAHPHYSESENIALIHNGIIENYRVLKDALEQNGYTFRSSTDSEVLVNLIEYVRATSGCSLPEAVRQALRQVIGAYAIAVVEKGNHDRIVAARQSRPMVVGVGDGEFFLSSDAASIIEYTEDFVYVGDGEIAVIDRNAPLKIVTLDNHDAKIDIKKLQLSISQLEKGGYPHFMLKEIHEQPKAAPLSNEDMNEFDKLLETIRKVLGDQIKDARVSHRLADSPACLVSPDDGVTSSMERLMRVMQKDDSIPQKIFEINRDHPLLRTMLKLSKADPDDPQLAEMIQSLFDSTLLLDGYIKDPHALASRATKLLEQASAWYADVKKL